MTISFRRVVCSKASVTIRLSASITLSMYATRFTFTNFALDIFGFVRFVREESMLLDRYSTRACDLFFIIQSEAVPSLPWEKKQLLTCLMSVPPPKRSAWKRRNNATLDIALSGECHLRNETVYSVLSI